MAIPITIPRLGWNMDEGVFAGWLKQDGDRVCTGETVFSLEGEKATEEIESFDEGILRFAPDAPKVGDCVAVGTVIGYLVAVGEAIPGGDALLPPLPRFCGREGWGEGEKPSPQIAQSFAIDSASPPHPALSPAKPGERGKPVPAISPRAKRAAQELGVDWTTIRGSGRTGRIRERDVRAAADFGSSIPHTATRKIIAERMRASHLAAAPVTLTTTADATDLVKLRDQFKMTADLVPSYTDFLVKFVASALQKHPLLNARWSEERIILSPGIHIGIAVDTEAGLLAPVIRDVPSLSLNELTARAFDLIARARQGNLKTADMEGGTFTVTNLGAFGIDAFTPIINLPQCAILGIGRIQRQPVVVDDQITIRDRVALSLTFDHRIVDARAAARFLQTLSNLIESPAVCLIDGVHS